MRFVRSQEGGSTQAPAFMGRVGQARHHTRLSQARTQASRSSGREACGRSSSRDEELLDEAYDEVLDEHVRAPRVGYFDPAFVQSDDRGNALNCAGNADVDVLADSAIL
jgi:DNA-binding FadR family transcriptional regulator